MRDWAHAPDRHHRPVHTADGLEGFALSTYIVHVVMHGIESLSAAAILLQQAGHSMGDVGYLDFIDVVGDQG